jgi:hypothetical protein
MSVTTISGYTLFPHRANYAAQPRLDRVWTTGITDSERGQEQRIALRAVPRRMLQWTITADDLEKFSQLADRILSAAKSGRACAPLWGRGSELASDASGSTVVLTSTAWPWLAGDRLFFLDDDDGYEIATVASVAGTTLTLATPLAATHAGEFIWPLIFGRFSADNLGLLTSRHGQAQLTISELTSPDAATLGAEVAQIDGVGGWIIGDTFIVQ